MTEIIKQYVDMRNQKVINVNWFVNYFKEKTGKSVGTSEMNMFLQLSFIDDIFNKLDKDLNLVLLYDKSNRLLKCYPPSN